MSLVLVARVCVVVALSFPVMVRAQGCQGDTSYQYANRLRDQGAYTDAVAVYEDVLKRHPTCMAAKIEVGFCLLRVGEYEKATAALKEAHQATLMDKDDPEVAAKVRKLIEIQLDSISQLHKQPRQRDETINLHGNNVGQVGSQAQVSAALGVSDNINGGVDFDELTFGPPGATITKKLGDKSKEQEGSWLDLEAAWQSALPLSEKVKGNLHLSASWRDVHGESESDLSTVRGVAELRPLNVSQAFEPRVVLSGGSFILDNKEYRNDLAIGGRVSHKVANHKVTLGYQFADHNYRTVSDLDGRYHRLSLSVPVISEKGSKKIRVGFDLGYQWPETVERLGDYRETSVRLRGGFEPIANHSVSASYGVSRQQDTEPYNEEFFNDAKRNIEQKVLDIGWAVELDKKLSLEANLQHRNRSSDIPLFEHDATDLVAGIRWQLD